MKARARGAMMGVALLAGGVLAAGANAANAQDQLLAQAHLAAAHVEDVGDRPVGRIVGRNVGVQQQERHAADPAAARPTRTSSTARSTGSASGSTQARQSTIPSLREYTQT